MKSGKLIILSPTGEQTEERLSGPDVPGYDRLSAAVGGLIERVRVRFAGRVRDAFVNEEGIPLGLPPNRAASALLAPPFTPGTYLAGNLAIWVPDPRAKKPQAA